AAATSIPVAVAGGLNSETVGEALKAGATIVIVGGAISKAEDVADATRTIKKAIHQRKSIPTGLYKKYTDANVGDAFRQVSTPNLADAMQKRGVMTGLGEIGSEIECGGQKVHTGDWIVGDESGLIVVAREEAVEMANRALDVLERENRIREEIKRGGTLSSVLELEKWEQIR